MLNGMTVTKLVCWLLLLGGSSAALAASAPYPTRTIRYVVPYAPGGATDLLARILAEKLHVAWAVPVIVDTRAGAAGQIGTDAVAKSAPDGYTMLMAINSHALNASFFSKLPYDPIKDFAPVMWLTNVPNVVTVTPDSPVKSTKELIALARAKPGVLTFASGGPGSGSNLAGALLKMMANVDIIEVPYKGAGPALTDMLGGQVTMGFVVLANAYPHIRSGKLRGLAVTSLNRSSLAPDLPTVAESAALPGYDVFSWYGTLAPAGTPVEIIDKWNSEFSRILQMPDVKEKLAGLGMEIKGGTPVQFAQFIRSDWQFWDKVIKQAGIRPE